VGEAERAKTYDPDTWCGKTSPERSAPTKARISRSSSKKQPRSPAKKLPLFLSLNAGGRAPDACPTWRENGALRGEFSTRSFGESPSAARGSHLSQILEGSPLPKYFLSAKACAGILCRADRKGKELPAKLREALERQSGLFAFRATPSADPTEPDAAAGDGRRASATPLTPLTGPRSLSSTPASCQGSMGTHTGKTGYAPPSGRRGGDNHPHVLTECQGGIET